MRSRGTSASRSPVGADDDRLDAPARVRPRPAASATSSAWRRARGEPRVARRSGAPAGPSRRVRRPRPLEVEEDAQRLDQPLAPGRAGGLLQEHRRLVQQLGQHRPGDRVHLGPVGLGRARPSWRRSRSSSAARSSSSRVRRARDDRRRAPGPAGRPVAVDLLGHDARAALDLGRAARPWPAPPRSGGRPCRAGSPRRSCPAARVDVAGHAEVDDEERPVRPCPGQLVGAERSAPRHVGGA